jgi:hypothetical protein
VSVAFSGARLIVAGSDETAGYEIAFDVVTGATFDEHELSVTETFNMQTQRVSTFSITV